MNASAKSKDENIAMVKAKGKKINAPHPNVESKTLFQNPSGSEVGTVQNKELQEHTYQKDENIGMVKAKGKKINALPPNVESKTLVQNPSGSGSVQNNELTEQTYQKVQNLKRKHLPMVLAFQRGVCNKLREGESSTQESKANLLENRRLDKYLRMTERIFKLFRMSKSQITADFQGEVDNVERMIHSIQIFFSKFEGELSAGEQPKPRFDSSCSRNSHQENQVVVQFIKSKQDRNQPSFTKDTGTAVQQQTHCTQATEASGVHINTMGISASPLVKDGNNPHETSHTLPIVYREPSPAMQRLVKAFTTISPEALRKAFTEIAEVVYMSDALPDALPMSPFVDERPQMEQQETQPTLIPKRCRSFEVFPIDTNSFTFKGKRPRIEQVCHNILEEIKEINNSLIDIEVVINGKEDIESKDGVAIEQNEGLVVKFIFNAVTINGDFISHITPDKKSLIKPLRVLVPTSYPLSSPVILDEMSLEMSEDLQDFFVKAKAKLRCFLESKDQSWSLKDMARSWDCYARETILEYAHLHGGGTFSSRYGGGWESVDFD